MTKFIPQKLKNYYHLTKAILANVLYGMPSKKINPHTNFLPSFLVSFLHLHGIGVGVKVIGVTGTNGKTTTVQMIAKILEEAGKKIAVASTINFKLRDKEWVNVTKFTTLSSFQVQRFISQAIKAQCEYVVLEISSHSLDQYRTWGINFDTAVVTNVTREHLDYHKTMENYRQAKAKLFKNAKNAVINLDMEGVEDFLKYDNKNKFLYSCHSELGSESRFRTKSGMTSVKAENIELGIDYTKYKIQDTEYQLNLPGLFNIENALAATCVGMAYNISPEIIKRALERVKSVPGRMEKVVNDKNIEIIIDYAVTPDSLKKIYDLISKNKKEGSKIISVFGACGERDRGKRPMMGEIVSNFADYIILTNEDPYGENPDQIIDEVLSGIKNKKEGKNFWRIMDRREAIRKGLQLAQPGDIFVITGKGAEETMAIGKKRIPWNDKKVILEELERMN